MAFCRGCGKVIEDDAVICVGCGRATGVPMPPAATTTATDVAAVETGWIIFSVLMAFILPPVGFFLGIWLMTRGSVGAAVACMVLSVIGVAVVLSVVT